MVTGNSTDRAHDYRHYAYISRYRSKKRKPYVHILSVRPCDGSSAALIRRPQGGDEEISPLTSASTKQYEICGGTDVKHNQDPAVELVGLTF